jgi:N-sulfoglucosamine sulfohydrolase
MPAEKGTRPNVLFIICHDLGTQLGCYGDPSLRTANLDSLADAGVRFDNYFCTTPLCSPSRGSILTGRYPHSNGLNGLTHRGFCLNPDERCLPELLAEAGYDTRLFGFQHEAADPRRLGYHWVSERGEPARCALITPKVVEFLRGYAGGGRTAPFFTMVGFSEVHRDFKHEWYQPDDPAKVFLPPYLPDMPEVREDFADFHGLIHAADASVGDLLRALAETGLAESTWVIFTTDHGVPFPRAKSTLYDPGTRTALIMRWPAGFAGGRGRPGAQRGAREAGRLGARRGRGELLSNIDLLPTLLEAAGLAIPQAVQGRSFWPLLAGGRCRKRDSIFAEKTYHDTYDPMRAIRTERYKYIRSYEHRPWLPLPTDIRRSLSGRAMAAKYREPRDPEELYDLARDPLEMENLAGRPEHEAVRQELSRQLTRWQEETQDPLLAGPMSAPDGARVDEVPW